MPGKWRKLWRDMAVQTVFKISKKKGQAIPGPLQLAVVPAAQTATLPTRTVIAVAATNIIHAGAQRVGLPAIAFTARHFEFIPMRFEQGAFVTARLHVI